ncbi:MAG: hemolysin III family protein [Micrococcales bacterium]|nr:hemolysin III family protein [Micrococcales bacterium]
MTSEADLGRDHVPLVDAERSQPSTEVKPLWRGWIHAGTFPLALALGVVLIVLADGGAAKAASAIFMATSLLLFGISATYHRIDWSPKVKAVFRRLDHSNIFLLIAGTYTPIAVCALSFPQSAILLTAVWVGAALGVTFRIFWLSAPRWLYVALYIALGWAAMFYMGDLVKANVATMVLILVGGLAYTLGAVFYALKRPNPVPGVFGFHEMFHTCTVIAFLCQWVGILLIAMNPVAG